MLRKLVNKLNIFNKDSIVFPEMGKRDVKKEAKMGIFKIKKSEETSALLKKVEETSLSFINVSGLLMGTERRSFVNRLQSFCKAHNMNVYGIDRSWVVVTNTELES